MYMGWGGGGGEAAAASGVLAPSSRWVNSAAWSSPARRAKAERCEQNAVRRSYDVCAERHGRAGWPAEWLVGGNWEIVRSE